MCGCGCVCRGCIFTCIFVVVIATYNLISIYVSTLLMSIALGLCSPSVNEVTENCDSLIHAGSRRESASAAGDEGEEEKRGEYKFVGVLLLGEGNGSCCRGVTYATCYSVVPSVSDDSAVHRPVVHTQGGWPMAAHGLGSVLNCIC